MGEDPALTEALVHQLTELLRGDEGPLHAFDLVGGLDETRLTRLGIAVIHRVGRAGLHRDAHLVLERAGLPCGEVHPPLTRGADETPTQGRLGLLLQALVQLVTALLREPAPVVDAATLLILVDEHARSPLLAGHALLDPEQALRLLTETALQFLVVNRVLGQEPTTHVPDTGTAEERTPVLIPEDRTDVDVVPPPTDLVVTGVLEATDVQVLVHRERETLSTGTITFQILVDLTVTVPREFLAVDLHRQGVEEGRTVVLLGLTPQDEQFDLFVDQDADVLLLGLRHGTPEQLTLLLESCLHLPDELLPQAQQPIGSEHELGPRLGTTHLLHELEVVLTDLPEADPEDLLMGLADHGLRDSEGLRDSRLNGLHQVAIHSTQSH